MNYHGKEVAFHVPLVDNKPWENPRVPPPVLVVDLTWEKNNYALAPGSKLPPAPEGYDYPPGLKQAIESRYYFAYLGSQID